jgi:polysaccharide export outer membrane protein
MGDVIREKAFESFGRWIALAALAMLGLSMPLAAQQNAQAKPASSAAAPSSRGETTQDYNLKIRQMLHRTGVSSLNPGVGDYQIGPEDLLQISVLEAPDLNRTVRVSDDGEISLPLLGVVQAAGLTSRGLEAVLENLLRHTYMKNPHVSVFVEEMKSHPVSVFGAVEKPGVYQIRDAKTLIEVLSMAQGLATDAGDTVIVMRHPGDPGYPPSATDAATGSATTTVPRFVEAASSDPAPSAMATDEPSGVQSIEISLKELLDSRNPRYNVLVYPGDVVKVTRAGIVYVVGEVRRPGGFLLKTNENISVLQALALAEGLTPTAQGKHARIISADGPNGSRREIAINLDKILKGKEPDLLLHSRDILFIPNSARKSAFRAIYGSAAGVIPAISGASVYRW